MLLGVTLSVLLLSAAGIYALMAFTVAQRRREVGIRLALGATPAQIIRAIFSRALRQLATGAALGALVNVVIIQIMPPSPDPTEPTRVLLAVVATLVCVGLLAAQGPTRRSLRIHPVAALREE